MIRMLFIILGIISFGLAMLGIFLPLLPTTPFLLLSATCFFKSSPRLYRWITEHRIWGKYILCYRKYRAVPLRAKWFTILLLWGVIGTSAFLFMEEWWIRFILLFIAVAVSIHLFRLKTVTKEMVDALYDQDSKD